jgi:acyl dehydratase
VTAATVFGSLDELRNAAGRHLGWSGPVTLDQERVDRFAEATGSGDLGLLVLSMSNLLLPEIVEVRGVSAGVNYGTGEVRFPSPAAVGMRLRAGAELTAVEEVRGGVQTTILVTMESDAGEPVCTIESLSRWLA